jgi:hypothetical protein
MMGSQTLGLTRLAQGENAVGSGGRGVKDEQGREANRSGGQQCGAGVKGQCRAAVIFGPVATS